MRTTERSSLSAPSQVPQVHPSPVKTGPPRPLVDKGRLEKQSERWQVVTSTPKSTGRSGRCVDADQRAASSDPQQSAELQVFSVGAGFLRFPGLHQSAVHVH